LVSSLAAGAAIGAVIKGILALKVAIIAVTGAFLGAKTAIAGLTAVMALSPIFAGALAVGGIVTGIYAITKALKGQREELQKLAAVNSGQFINNLSASERATKISATKSLLAEQGRIIREENEKLGQTEDKRAKRAIVERLSAAKKEEDRLSRNLKRLTAPVTEKDLKVSQFDDLISKDDKTGKAAEKEANRIAALQRAIAEFESRRKLLDIEAKITEARQAQVLAQSRGDVPLSDFIDDKLVALELEKAAAEESARYEAKEREIRETMSGQVADLSNQLNIMESIRAKQEAEARASAQTLDNEIRKTVELEAQNRLIAQSLVDRKFELGFITKSEYNQFLLNRERERINKEFSRAAPEERDQLLDLYRQQIDPTFAEGLAQNIRKIKAELEELINPINQVTSAANAIGTAFTDSFTSVINGSATTQEALANFFQSLSSYFLDMAAQIIQKMITMAILNQVLGLLPGLGSSASGFNLGGFGNLASDAGSGISGFLAGAAGILGNAKGNAFDGGLVTKPTMFAYANGGVGRFGLMGEAGPEAIMPLQRDSSGRLGVQASGGGGTVINITNNISDTQSNSKVNGSRDGKAAADQLSKLMVAVIQKEQRPGGVLNRR
jgi:lambda family phage tail tape measure protein